MLIIFIGCALLSLLRNPVVHKPAYRLYAIFILPQLRVLDFRRIRQKVLTICMRR